MAIEKIKEEIVKCSFCKKNVKSQFVIKAKKFMIIGDLIYPSGSIICKDCLEKIRS